MLLFRRLVQLSRANLNSRASCESVNPLLGIHLCGKLQGNLIARRKVLQVGMIAKTLVKKAWYSQKCSNPTLPFRYTKLEKKTVFFSKVKTPRDRVSRASAIALLCLELQVLACATLAAARGGYDLHVSGSELNLLQWYVQLHIEIHILL